MAHKRTTETESLRNQMTELKTTINNKKKKGKTRGKDIYNHD